MNTFDGEENHRPPSRELIGQDVLQQLMQVGETTFSKAFHKSKEKKKQSSGHLNWMKKSIFFELSYWSTLRL